MIIKVIITIQGADKLNEEKVKDGAIQAPEKLRDVYGLIYSTYGELGPKPELMIPDSVTYDLALEILMRSTCFISVDFEKMADRISNFPFPEYSLIGLTYFFKDPSTTSELPSIASITLLIPDELSSFINRNIENIKENLYTFSRDLIKEKDNKKPLLLKYYYDLTELIKGYKSIKILTDESAYTTEKRLNCILLSYFHGKMGPIPFFCYPDILDTDFKNLISRELEMNISEGFFTRSYPNFIVFHHYFELTSEMARGKSEMCLISFVFNKMPSKEQINNITFHFSELFEELKNEPYASFGFYKDGYSHTDKIELVQKMNSYLHEWVIKVYEICLENAL